jgi:hypothetical protein
LGDTFIVTLHDIVRISSKNTLDCQKRVLRKKIVISNWKKECIEKNVRKKCNGETTMSHAGKVNVRTHIFDLNVHFWGLYLSLALFASNLPI